ncbi:ATP-binding protein [Streptomyces sp. NPDC091682]|uniref:ATP-binding protein n=1 Tax=Streptomyces sp. NPDC091682 TaxID=3366005 RepID=UPI0037FD302F
MDLERLDFDFAAQPGVDEKLIRDLATLRFLDNASNVLLVGPPGVGETMLAVALARFAVDAGHRVDFTTAAELAAKCHKVGLEGRWSSIMGFFAGPRLLVIDLCRDRDYADNLLARVASSPVWSAFETSRWKGDPLARGVHPCARAVRMAWATSAGTTGLVVRPNQFSGWCQPVSTTRTVPGTVASSTANVSGPHPFDWQ